MTTSSEDVLLQMGEVRYKKGDGTLYVMNERLAWMAENRDTVAVSHRFQDIKMQKISPEGKPKVQLQVVLHDGNSSTFHFVNRNGQSAQIADRDKVKELLQQLLPNFKRKVDRELEEKNRILSENPNLLQLYKDLVITQVLTSEEFWSTYAISYTQNRNTKKQEIGVSGAFLADIKPQTDGCNGLKYNLTADIIHCIFKTYPAVKRKHSEYVPTKLSESEFWTKFFQSHYFHRDRIITTGIKDIFTECGKIDDQTLKAAVQKGPNDPLLDLRSFEDNSLEDGFGGSSQNDKTSGVNSGNIVHQSIIKRFNQHSIMVLKACTDVTDQKQTENPLITPTDGLKNDSNVNGIKANKKSKTNSSSINGSNSSRRSSTELQNDESVSKIKRQRILEKICYDDLGSPQIDDNSNIQLSEQKSQQKDKNQQLNLSKIERYLHGPVPLQYTETIDDIQNLDIVQDQILQNLNIWNQRIPPHKSLVSATSAVNVLGELSPGGALMRGFQEQSLAQLIPSDVEKELRNLYLALNELLKHFWHCFPPTTQELETKAVRMHESLQRFKIAKLIPFEEKSMRELAPLGASLTHHLNQLLQAASRKFNTWQERRLRQHR